MSFFNHCQVIAECFFIHPCKAVLNISLNPAPVSAANAAYRFLPDQQFY